MKKIYLGSNFKMNKTISEVSDYINSFHSILSEVDTDEFYFFIIPSYTTLQQSRKILEGFEKPLLHLGAQNVSYAEEGEYTGEVSARMLKEIPVDIVEMGHSERRNKFHEKDELLNRKLKLVLKHGMRPLLCIGERADEKNFGISKIVLQKQMAVALNGIPEEDLEKIMIAYEPVWAIGAGGTPAEPGYVGDIHSSIRKFLGELYTPEAASRVTLLFGGSVNHSNYLDYYKKDDVDGLFIGRAAWDPVSFREIILGVRNLSLN